MKKRILIIDDNKSFSYALQFAIKYHFSDKIICVDTVYTGLDGLEKFKTNPYDIIFIDQILPDILGNILIKEMCKIKRDPFIIGISCENEHIKKMLLAGAKSFYCKDKIDMIILEKILNNDI